tara:strand:+ start:86 stop:676 length:591 start_codon:yes stop_codon:yes gene_type:complete
MFFSKKSINKPDLIILGIGNPGAEYSLTRHNVGLWGINQLTKNTEIKLNKKNKNINYGEGIFFDKLVLLGKSRVFVNQSGLVIKYLNSKYNLNPVNYLIIYDDIHLPAGKIRIREKGSAGGHNGIKSIIDAFGTQDFPRLRIGIGKPNKDEDQINYVLSEPSDLEKQKIEGSLKNVTNAVSLILSEGIKKAMNSFN